MPHQSKPSSSVLLNAKLNLVGESPAFHRLLAQIERFARCEATVLINGETGTGKELTARSIHYLSGRCEGPFIPINCGSLPDALFGSELFGHTRGAFTDAHENRQGLIAQAEGGTLFLDLEVIALLPPDADATPPAGVSRTLVKPLCTADLGGFPAAIELTQIARPRALPVNGLRGRALVVEDNAVNQEMARAMLDMMGFHVVTASNGQEGVQAAAADPSLNLIFMDCQMPIMDGLSAARAIRAAEGGGPRVPIVALTGNAMPGDREACVAAGMDDYLAKPFSLTALRAIVDKWAGARPN